MDGILLTGEIPGQFEYEHLLSHTFPGFFSAVTFFMLIDVWSPSQLTEVVFSNYNNMIAFIGFVIRRSFRRGPLPPPEPKGEAQQLIREASPACPHCGAGLTGQLSGTAGSPVECPGCGESVRESDVVYTVDSR